MGYENCGLEYMVPPWLGMAFAILIHFLRLDRWYGESVVAISNQRITSSYRLITPIMSRRRSVD
jgi:hypothetical protein